ncbi:MAG: response regulator transcription factor [Alphaproteobacteria bacterium]|nr:response regulator transcription factor [Alphaproteobacteria bacterium]
MAKTILVIDDDEMLQNALRIGLHKAGFNIINAQSAEIAKDILNRISVDAIVLDRMMTGQDGLSFLKEIRADGNMTPVIMLTAMSGAQNTIDGLTVGANDYMSKPFQLQELVLRLNNITKNVAQKPELNQLPTGLVFVNDEFFVHLEDNQPDKLLSLSKEEKKLLQNLLNPIGNTVSATPMVAKRLRNKINSVLSTLDIITVRGMGYKIILTKR